MNDHENIEHAQREVLECVNGPDGCSGPAALRAPLPGALRGFPRCEQHYQERLELETDLGRRYPTLPPRDWSPADAGETWAPE
jgi:hypothetical protein